MAEATYLDNDCEVGLVAVAAMTPGQVIQLNNGKAGVITGMGQAVAAGDPAAAQTEGVFTIAKAASVVILDGAPLWWDHSANAATPVPPLAAGDRDFYLGCAAEDAAASATTVKVLLNEEPHYEIDIHRDGGDVAIVKTVVGSTTVEVPNVINRGGSVDLLLGTTAEAQKVDWLSKRSFALGSNWILEAVIDVVANGDADVVDLSVGVANDTHASDADAITEAALFHLDMGGSLNILAESDDGTTEVGATDTTIDWAVGTPVHLVIDGRDPSDCRFYVNGVEVLNATADLGNIAAATGPLKALVHLEKSSNDSPGRVQVDMLRVRMAEQD